MSRREDTANELDRRHREIDTRTIGAERQLLLGLRGVAVTDGAEGAHDADTLRMVGVFRRLSAALARSDLALDDHRPRAIDDVGGEQRQQSEDRRGRVASGSGHALGAADVVAMQLGNAVDPAAELARMRMRLAVPPLVVGGISESMVAREVDDQVGATFEFVGAMRAIRQAEEQHIAAPNVLVSDELQVRALSQVWVCRRDGLARERFAPRHDLADFGVAEQQSHELATGVPAGADNPDLHRPFDLAASVRSATART